MDNWLDKMIERQAMPEEVREGSCLDFCKKYGISESTYYYQSSKPENQKKIIACALNNAKKHAPEVLENLGVRGKKDNRAAELYIKFILELAEKTDLTSKGEQLGVVYLPQKNELDTTDKTKGSTS